MYKQHKKVKNCPFFVLTFLIMISMKISNRFFLIPIYKNIKDNKVKSGKSALILFRYFLFDFLEKRTE
jgi:hypothetical protein